MADEFGVAVVITNQVVQADLGGGASMFAGPGIKVSPFRQISSIRLHELDNALPIPYVMDCIPPLIDSAAHRGEYHGPCHNYQAMVEEGEG